MSSFSAAGSGTSSLTRPNCFNGFCEPPAITVKSGASVMHSPVYKPPDWVWAGPGLAAGAVLHNALEKPSTVDPKALPTTKKAIEKASMYLPAAVRRQQYLNFNHPMYALVRLATLYHQYHGPLMAYVGATAVGALLAALLQGMQETWVRQQETQIRQQLIEELQGSFAQSLQTKYQFDAQLRQQATAQIVQLLEANGINPKPYGLLTPDTHLKTAYNPVQPTHRTAHFAGNTPKPAKTRFGLPLAWAALGAASGLLLGHMTHWLRQQRHTLPIAQQEVMECLVTADMESAFLLRHKGMLAGVFTLGALAKAGQLLLNTTREVAVTRKNADTERRYQQNNWQVLDPRFHALAEQAAWQADWQQLVADLPQLKRQPARLQARLLTVLDNRGKASPPGYYLATPPVMLSEAKS
jgi:hypothetical protein